MILTDQSHLFPTSRERGIKSPYWQDTCALKPILDRYFNVHFPEVLLDWIVLTPTNEKQSLDNWNSVLDLTREQLDAMHVQGTSFEGNDNATGIANDLETVYVSHQAGTPAISSAVQFSTLARFRETVTFLVSSEQHPQATHILSSSSYLNGIRKQEAKALLDRHDYSGVRDILGLAPGTSLTPDQKYIKRLLDAGEQWNFAEFHKFKNRLTKAKIIEKKQFPWWRLGYESAYLAMVRLEQGNTVEALFHSFRAMEGMISKWAEKHFADDITQKGDADYQDKYGPQIRRSICRELPEYYDALSNPNRDKLDRYGSIGLYGDPLYELFRQARPDWRSDRHIRIVWDTAKQERNTLFHCIEGLQPNDVFKAWEIELADDGETTLQQWQKRLVGCLNFIAKDDLPQKEGIPQLFSSLAEASVMARVHEALEGAIATL